MRAAIRIDNVHQLGGNRFGNIAANGSSLSQSTPAHSLGPSVHEHCILAVTRPGPVQTLCDTFVGVDPFLMGVIITEHQLDGLITHRLRICPGLSHTKSAHALSMFRTETDVISLSSKVHGHLVKPYAARKAGRSVVAGKRCTFQGDSAGSSICSKCCNGKRTQNTQGSHQQRHEPLAHFRLCFQMVLSSFYQILSTDRHPHGLCWDVFSLDIMLYAKEVYFYQQRRRRHKRKMSHGS